MPPLLRVPLPKSRVFTDAPNVTPKTRDRVMKVATALHYHPNVVAQGLVGRRSYLLGLLYENPSPNYVVELQQGALARLQGREGQSLEATEVVTLNELIPTAVALPLATCTWGYCCPVA